MSCDMCGAGIGVKEIPDLWKTKGIEYACPGCRRLLHKHLDRIAQICKSFTVAGLRKFSQEHKNKKLKKFFTEEE